MDYAVVTGIGLALAVIFAGMALVGGSVRGYLSIEAFLIVVVGTTASTLAGITFREAKSVLKIFKEVLFPKKIDWFGTVDIFSKFANESRREGVLSLQSKIDEQQNDLIKLGLQLIVDGADSDVLFQVIGTKIQLLKNRNALAEQVFVRMNAMSPTFGLIGTVLGLIQVLGNISEPEKLAAGISAAFLTTFYGVAFSGLVFHPVANKIGYNNSEKSRYCEMILTGLQSIHEGDNPFMAEEKLMAFCPENITKKELEEVVSQEGASKYGSSDLQTETP